MTKISLYPEISTPGVDDLLIGTDVNDGDATKNFSIQSVLGLNVVTNATTTALSVATLNSTYPDSIVGFKVQCKSITSGKLIYERTSTGWISYSITLVS